MESKGKCGMSVKKFSKKVYYLIRGMGKQDGIEKKLKFLSFYRLADKNGVINFRLERIAQEYTDDYFADTGVSREDKSWYYERGIPSFKTGWYGLTKENYNDYISDFDFYGAINYPSNRQLINWFDYKLTTYYVLSAFRDNMPGHYFYIEKGCLLPMDTDVNRMGKPGDVLSVVREKPVALKSCTGGHGKGFYKLSYGEEGYMINGRNAGETEVVKLIESLDDYLVTDYAVPHKVFREACGENTFAVLRTVTVFDKNEGPQLTAVLIRLGTSGTGIVSDYDGCINCGVDVETGKLFNPLLRTGDAEGIIRGTPTKNHPDTGVDLESVTVPDYADLVSLAKSVSAHLSMTPYLVMDVIPTDSGFKILEINSHGQVRNLEPFYPFRKNKYNLRAFVTKDR